MAPTTPAIIPREGNMPVRLYYPIVIIVPLVELLVDIDNDTVVWVDMNWRFHNHLQWSIDQIVVMMTMRRRWRRMRRMLITVI